MSIIISWGILNPQYSAGDRERLYREGGRRGMTETRIIAEMCWEKQHGFWNFAPYAQALGTDDQPIWWNNYALEHPEYPMTPLFQMVKESRIRRADGSVGIRHPDEYLPTLSLDASTGKIVAGSFWDKYLRGTEAAPFTSNKNQAWWDDLAEIIGWVKKYVGCYQITLLDGCSFARQGWKKYLLFWYGLAEKRGIPPPSTIFGGGPMDPGFQRFHLIWMKDLLDFCKAMGCPFKLEPWNECRYSNDYLEDYLKGWLTWYYDALRRSNLPAGTEIVSNGWPNTAWLGGISDKVSIHGYSKPEEIEILHGIDNRRIIISCDGGFKGDGDANEKGGKSPSLAQLGSMVQDKIVPYTLAGLDIFTRRAEGQGIPIPQEYGGGVQPNLDAANFDEVTAMVQAAGMPEYEFVDVCEATGLLPNSPYCPIVVNRKIKRAEVPTSICQKHQKPPDPEKSCCEKYIMHRKMKDWNIKAWWKCLWGKE